MSTVAPYVAHLASAGELVASKRFGEAEGEILRALSAGSAGDTKALTLLALVRYKLGRFEDARATYREIAGAAPQDAAARRNSGLLALKLGRIDDAVPDLEMAVRLAPADGRAWSYLGYAYAKKGELVEAAAAFRRAGQDALAIELEQAAKVHRPPTPAWPVRAQQPKAEHGSLSRPVALAPPLPPVPAAGGRRVVTAKQHAVPARELPVRAAAAAAPAPVSAPATANPEPVESPTAPRPRVAEPVPLLSFVLGRLGQAAAPPAPEGPLRLVIADEAHVRDDAILAGAGALHWEPAVRRGQGKLSAELLGVEGRRYHRLTGAGEVWIAGAVGRWQPLRLADDVLYVREDRVLAFEGSLAWEAGTVPNTGLRMLQFRGRGIVALSLPEAAIAIKVTDEHPTLLAGGRLVGWVGRLVPHGARLPEGAPFQLACQGEGVVLVEAAG